MKLDQMFSHWELVRRGLLAIAAKFSDDELHYCPFEGSWSVGQILLHIADCEDNWLHGVVQRIFEPWIFYDFKDYPDRKAILEKLDAAHQRTKVMLANLDESDLENEYCINDDESYTLKWMIWHVLEHEIHHRGELSLMLGMLGHDGLDV